VTELEIIVVIKKLFFEQSQWSFAVVGDGDKTGTSLFLLRGPKFLP